MGFDIFPVSVVAVIIVMQSNTDAAPTIASSRQIPVIGQSLDITCTLEVTITDAVVFKKMSSGQVVPVGGCTSPTSCSSTVTGYTPSVSGSVVTLTITSVNKTREQGTWNCEEINVSTGVTNPSSNSISLSQFSSVLDWSSVTFNPSLTSLPTSVAPQVTISVTITTPCAEPAPTFSWTYQGISSGSLDSNTYTTTPTSCGSPGQFRTTHILSLPGSTTSLYGKRISLTVSVEHPSFAGAGHKKTSTTNSIQFPVPVTSVQLSDITPTEEGQTTTITCQTSDSFPAATVTWMYTPPGVTPGVRLDPITGTLQRTISTLSFTANRIHNGQSTRCQAYINGQTPVESTEKQIEIWFGPDRNRVQVTKPTPNTPVFTTRDLTLTCTAEASPSVTFSWSGVSGGSVGAVTRSGYTWSQTLTFRPSRSTNDVSCTAINTRVSTLRDTGTISLDVKYPPDRPAFQNFPPILYARDQFTASCSVSGGNPRAANITLSCAGHTSPGTSSTSASVTLEVSKIHNSQTCLCTAGWRYPGYDEQSDTRTMTVYFSPEGVTINSPSFLCKGRSTTLTCSLSDSGNPPATFHWYKNSQQVHTQSSYSFTPRRSDNGVAVGCSAGNNYTDRSGGSRPQSKKTLTVYYIERPSITPSDQNSLTKKEGDGLSLRCNVDSNPSTATTIWQFGSTTSSGNSLMKTNLSRSDDGQYTCTGRVTTGNSQCQNLQESRSVSVTVNFAPDITFNKVDIQEGDDLTLTCTANGRPNTYNFNNGGFTQHWGDTQLDQVTGRQSGGVYTVTKQTASYLDTGTYLCTVDNGVSDRRGHVEQTARTSVLVRAHPKFAADTVGRVGEEVGHNVTLLRRFYSSFMNYTSYNWTKEGRFLKGSINQSSVRLVKKKVIFEVEGFAAFLVITKFQEADIGTYTFTVCNSIGCGTSSVNLTGAGPPLVPLDLIIVNHTETSVSLRWKSNFPGGDFTQVFILHYREQGTENWETREYGDNSGGYVLAEITGLKAGTKYEFRVMARNDRATGERDGQFTQIIEVKTEETPKPPPSSIVAAAVGGAGAAVVVVAVVGVVIFLKRRKGHAGNRNSTGNSGPTIAANQALVPDLSQYSDLNSLRDTQPYSELKVYQNITRTAPDVKIYDSLQDKQPPTYEQLHTYYNTAAQLEGSNPLRGRIQNNTDNTYESVSPQSKQSARTDTADPAYANT